MNDMAAVIAQITQDGLKLYLPDGAVIKHVLDPQGAPTVNVADASGDWQAAVPVSADVDATVEQIISAAWTQEHHMRHLLLVAEARENYQEELRGLQAQLEAEKTAVVSDVLAQRKAARPSS